MPFDTYIGLIDIPTDYSQLINVFIGQFVFPADYAAFICGLFAAVLALTLLTRKRTFTLRAKHIGLLLCAAAVYMTIPPFLFILSLPIEWTVKAALEAALIFFSAKAAHGFLRNTARWENAETAIRVGFVVLFLGLMLSSYAALFWGRGFVGDWRMHRSKLLSIYSHPLRPAVGAFYGIMDARDIGDYRLCYYLGDYMPAAWAVNLVTTAAENPDVSYLGQLLSDAYFAWNFIGLAIAALLLPAACRTFFGDGAKKWGIFYIMILMSAGMDYWYRAVWRGTPHVGHAEWDLPYYAQISSFISVWQWVPQHFTPAILSLILLFILYDKPRLFPLALFSTYALSSSVFVWAGTIPLIAWLAYRGFIKPAKDPLDALRRIPKAQIAGAAVFAFVLLTFYFSRSFDQPEERFKINSSLLWEGGTENYLLFMVFELLPYFVIFIAGLRLGIRPNGLMAVSAAAVIVLPLFEYLRWNPLAMRGNLPSLFAIMAYCAFVCQKLADKKGWAWKLPIVAFVVLAMPQALNEYIFGLATWAPLFDETGQIRYLIGPDTIAVPTAFGLLHLAYATAAWAALNLLPGLVAYLIVRRDGYRFVESIAFSLAMSPILTATVAAAFGYLGAPLWFSAVFAVLASAAAAHRFAGGGRMVFRNIRHAIVEEQREWSLILPVALALAAMIAVPPLLNPLVTVRSDNQLHAGIVHSILNTGIPPEAPYLAGQTLQYYWLYDLANLMTSYACAIPATSAIYVTNVTGFFTLLLMVWLIGKSVGGTRMHGLMAVVFMAFGLNAYRGLEIAYLVASGSMSLSGLKSMGAVLGALTGGGNASMPVGFLVGHAMAASLGFIAGGLYCLDQYRKTGDGRILAPFFVLSLGAVGYHPPTGIYYGLALGIYIVLEAILDRGKMALKIFAVLAAVAVMLLPYNLGITSEKTRSIWDNYVKAQVLPSNAPGYPDEWLRHVLSPLASIAQTHLQIVCLLAALGILFRIFKADILMASALIGFSLTYVLFNTPGGDWENTLLLMLPLSVYASVALVDAVSKVGYRSMRWGAYLAVAVLLSPASVMTVYGYTTEQWWGQPESTVRMYDWVNENTPEDAVMVYNNLGYFMSEVRRSSFIFDTFGNIHGANGTLTERRMSLVNDIIGGRNVTANAAAICQETGRPLYIVVSREETPNIDAMKAFTSHPEYFQLNTLKGGDGNTAVIGVRCERLRIP
jgi:hypothetical protein